MQCTSSAWYLQNWQDWYMNNSNLNISFFLDLNYENGRLMSCNSSYPFIVFWTAVSCKKIFWKTVAPAHICQFLSTSGTYFPPTNMSLLPRSNSGLKVFKKRWLWRNLWSRSWKISCSLDPKLIREYIFLPISPIRKYLQAHTVHLKV